MKKGVVCLVLAICLILPGCSKGENQSSKEEKEIVKIKQISQNASGYEAKLSLNLSYPKQSGLYRLGITYAKKGKTTISILEPDYMAGFSIMIEGEKTVFLYDGEPFEDGGGFEKLPVSLLRQLCEFPFITEEQMGKVEEDMVYFKREEQSALGPVTSLLTVDKKNALPLGGELVASFLRGEIEFLQFSYINENANNINNTNDTDKKDERND